MKRKAANRALTFSLLFLLMGGSRAALAQQAGSPEVKLQPLDIKIGLWETTRTFKTVGELPIPAATLDKLTPEQRARLQERMSANSAGHSNTTTDKHCVTKAELEQRKLEVSASKECRPTVTTSTSSVAKGKLSCEIEGMRGSATFEAEALDPEHVKGSAHGSMSGGGHTLNFDGSFSSKWLGSACGNVE